MKIDHRSQPAPDLPDRPVGLAQSLTNAVYALAKTGHYKDPAQTVREYFPHDRAAASFFKTRTDAGPATLGTSGWGGVLSGAAVSAFIANLPDAGGKLIAAGTRLSLSGTQTVLIPKRKAAVPPATIGWVSESSPISVRQGDLDSVQLGPPKKLGAMIVVSRELLEYSDGVSVLGRMLTEEIGATLAASLLSSTAGDSTRPAGLLVDITPLTPAVASTTPSDQISQDFANLAGAICDAGGSGDNIVYICSPRQAAYARLHLITNDPITIWSSRALADGDIVAIQPDAFVSAFSAEPIITLRKEATLVMTDPGAELVPAVTGASPMSNPARSMFQTDTVGVKVVLPCAWVLRQPLIATVSASWGLAPA